MKLFSTLYVVYLYSVYTKDYISIDICSIEVSMSADSGVSSAADQLPAAWPSGGADRTPRANL